MISHGEGCWLYDTKGKRYFDGLAGLFCTQIGYSYGGELGEAAAKQMRDCRSTPTGATPTRARSSWRPRWPSWRRAT